MKVSPNMTSTSVANSDRRALGWAGFFLSILLIGGCSALPDKPVRPAVYDFGPGLVPKATPAPAASGVALPPLLLADIEAPATVDGTAVLYRLAYADVQQLRPYAQARWSMPPAQLVRQRLRDPLSQQRVVLNPAEGPAGWILRLELEEFTQVFERPIARWAWCACAPPCWRR
jgi:cholesterol transport system auxiliary component